MAKISNIGNSVLYKVACQVARPLLCLEPLPLLAQNASLKITQPSTNAMTLMVVYHILTRGGH